MYVIEKENGVCFKNLAHNRKYFLFVYIEQFIIKLSEMVIFPKVLKVKFSLSTHFFQFAENILFLTSCKGNFFYSENIFSFIN